ncbi:hypothetical protein MPLA_1620052 [Mesorhizobium sp. ORS 3359]|nr:hypothetical protein MPLA_1620052 [Mesorhizobium sp. ORS 3359]
MPLPAGASNLMSVWVALTKASWVASRAAEAMLFKSGSYLAKNQSRGCRVDRRLSNGFQK